MVQRLVANLEEKASSTLLQRQSGGYSVCGRKGCTPTSPEADTELPMFPVGEGSQPYLEDEKSVATSFSHRGSVWALTCMYLQETRKPTSSQHNHQHWHWSLVAHSLWLVSSRKFACEWLPHPRAPLSLLCFSMHPAGFEHQGNGDVDTSLGNALWPPWLVKKEHFIKIKSKLCNRQKPDMLFSCHLGDKWAAVCGHLIWAAWASLSVGLGLCALSLTICHVTHRSRSWPCVTRHKAVQGIHWDGVDPNKKHMWNIFALVKTVLSADTSVKREGSSLNAEVSLGWWILEPEKCRVWIPLFYSCGYDIEQRAGAELE